MMTSWWITFKDRPELLARQRQRCLLGAEPETRAMRRRSLA